MFKIYDAMPQKPQPQGATTIEQLGTHYFISPDQMIVACANAMFGGEVAIEQLLNIITEFYQAESAFIFERDYEAKKTRNTHAFYDSNHSYLYSQMKNKVFPFDPESPWHQRISESPFVYLEADEFISSGFPYVGSYFVDARTENFVIAPIKENGVDMGIVGLSNVKNNVQHFHLFPIIKSFCYSALKIKHQQKAQEAVMAQLAQRNTHMQGILDCVTTLVGDESTDASVGNLLQVVRDYYNAHRVHILKIEGETMRTYQQFECLKEAKPSISNLQPCSLEVVNRWFEQFGTENVLKITSVEEELGPTQKHTSEYGYLVEDKATSFLATRLFCKGKVMGFLWIDAPKQQADDTELVKTVATFVENHLNKGDLLDKLKALREQM